MNREGGDARAVEAILFAAGSPVKYARLGEALGMTEAEAKEFVSGLAGFYDGRGIELVIYEDGCMLCTRSDYEEQVRAALALRVNSALPNSAMEALAIIACRQPVTRAYIERIRGADSAYAVNLLSDRGLIEVRGRLDVPGRPLLYGTTETFLRCFGLSSPEELKIDSNIILPPPEGGEAE